MRYPHLINSTAFAPPVVPAAGHEVFQLLLRPRQTLTTPAQPVVERIVPAGALRDAPRLVDPVVTGKSVDALENVCFALHDTRRNKSSPLVKEQKFSSPLEPAAIARDMAKTFRTALLEHLAKTGEPLAQVAARAGVSYPQLKRLKAREGASTNVEDAMAIAHAFGVTLDEFLGDTMVADRIEIVGLYNQLSPSEREILRAAARGRDAQDHAEVK